MPPVVRFTVVNGSQQHRMVATLNGEEIELQTPMGNFSTKVPGEEYSNPRSHNIMFYCPIDEDHCLRLSFFLAGSQGPGSITITENDEPGYFDLWSLVGSYYVAEDPSVFHKLSRIFHTYRDRVHD